MGRTMVLHVGYKTLYISFPSSAKQQRQMTTTVDLKILYFEVCTVPHIQFQDGLKKRNKLNDFRVPRDSQIEI